MEWALVLVTLALFGQDVGPPQGLAADPWEEPGAAPWLCGATRQTVRRSHVVVTSTWDGERLLEQRFRLPAAAEPHAVLAWAYDGEGRRIREELRWPGTGAVRVTTWAWDAAGRLVAEEVDQPVDGAIDDRRTWTYDVQGNLVEERWERPAAGGTMERAVHAHDEGGRRTATDEYDGADTDPSVRVTYAHDAAGRIVRAERDRGPDGSVDAVVTSAYDAAGRLVREETDEGPDGTADWTHAWTYDGEGRLLREWAGRSEAAADEVRTWGYDARGRLVRETVDRGGDGGLESWTDYGAWDDAGHPTRGDQRAPDVAWSERLRWARDEGGRLWREERTLAGEAGASGRALVTWARDAAGRVTDRCEDGDGDGTPERHERWTWQGPHGDHGHEVDDRSGEDPVRERVTVDRDAARRLVAVAVDGQQDGVVDRTWAFDWAGGAGAAPRAELAALTEDGRERTCETTRDEAGRARSRAGRDAAGRITERVAWDEQGRVVAVTADLAGSGALTTRVLAYDAAGRVVRWERLAADGRTLERWTCEWQAAADGRVTRSVCADLTGTDVTTDYEWDTCAAHPPAFACRVAGAGGGGGGGCAAAAAAGAPTGLAGLALLLGACGAVAWSRRTGPARRPPGLPDQP